MQISIQKYAEDEARIGIESVVMLDDYLKEIHSVVKLEVPAWHRGLTVKQSADIKRIYMFQITLYDRKTLSMTIHWSLCILS